MSRGDTYRYFVRSVVIQSCFRCEKRVHSLTQLIFTCDTFGAGRTERPLERLLLLHMQQMTARLLNRARDPTTLSARAPISHQSLLIHCRDRGRECLSNKNHSDLRRLGHLRHFCDHTSGRDPCRFRSDTTLLARFLIAMVGPVIMTSIC